MNMRISSPPASTASGTVSHHETATLRCIRYHSSPYGTKVLSSCHIARQVEGCWYLSMTCFHDGRGTAGLTAGAMMGATLADGTPAEVMLAGAKGEYTAMTVLRKLASRATAAQYEL